MANSMRVSVALAALLLASLVTDADSASMRGAPKQIAPNNQPYKKRCPMKAIALAELAEVHMKINGTMGSNVPGAGMDPDAIKKEFAAGKIYKDGFYTMGCIKDYMYYKGDKFGDNKYDYELEKISNVSIVFPKSFVPKEDQEPTTIASCYNMCRQLENMNFFGIVNGRDCYCAPYVKPMAGDDSMCTAVCDGDKGAVCGSKTKSSIFQMHSCDDTLAQLTSTTDLADSLLADLAIGRFMKMGAVAVDSKANAMKKAFGEVGDPETSNLFQESLDIGSKLGALAKKAEALKKEFSNTAAEGKELMKEDFTVYENAAKADSIMAELGTQASTAEEVIEELKETGYKTAPGLFPQSGAMALNASEQYYPIMYFEDKKFEKSPTSCSGKLLNIYLGTSKDVCAKACDFTDTEGCIGFLYVPGQKGKMGPMPDSFCFTFSAITTMQYYTKEGCPDSEVMCYGKLSKLQGTTPLDKEKGQKAVEADSRCMPVTTGSKYQSKYPGKSKPKPSKYSGKSKPKPKKFF